MVGEIMAEETNHDEVQPVDGYVLNLLKIAKEEHGLDIDLERPTRSQRLEAALAMKDESDGFYSMEIMIGRRVSSNEEFAQTFAMLKMAEAMNPRSDDRKFYDGFAHQYWPDETD